MPLQEKCHWLCCVGNPGVKLDSLLSQHPSWGSPSRLGYAVVSGRENLAELSAWRTSEQLAVRTPEGSPCAPWRNIWRFSLPEGRTGEVGRV